MLAQDYRDLLMGPFPHQTQEREEAILRRGQTKPRAAAAANAVLASGTDAGSAGGSAKTREAPGVWSGGVGGVCSRCITVCATKSVG